MELQLLTSSQQASIIICVLLVTAVYTFHQRDGENNNLDIAILFDVSNETLNQTCNLKPISNTTQWQRFIVGYFNSFLRNTNYLNQLRNLSLADSTDTWGTAVTTQFLLESLHHIIIFWGSDINARTCGVVANMHSAPVVSLLPRHSWFKEGAKLPNVVIPRTGQSLKGIAALDLINPTDDHNMIETTVIFREEEASPEVEQLLQAKYNAARLHIFEFILSEQTLQLLSSIPNSSGSTDSIIIDSDLDLFYRAMTFAIDVGFINEKTIVIFLHEFTDILTWDSLKVLTATTSFVFAFRQRIHSSSSNVTFEEGLFLDALQAIAKTVVSSNYNPNAHIIEAIQNITFLHQQDGHQLINTMKKECVHGYSGSFGFSSGKALDSSCLNRSLVEFDIMRVNATNWKKSGPCQYNWYEYGEWTGTGGLRIREKLWELSFDKQQTNEEIKVLIVPFGPFTYLKKGGEWTGVDMDLLNYIVANGSVGFQMSQIKFTKWNGSREAAIQELQGMDGGTYHIVLGAIISHASTDNIKYTRSYYGFRMGMVTLRGKQDSDFIWRFMQPFHWSVWLAAAAAILLGGVTSKWLGLTQTYVDGVWIAACTIFFVQENRIVQMRNPFGRVFIIALSAFVLILISAYTANLVSFLSPGDRSQTTIDPTISSVVTLDRQPYRWLLSHGFSNVTTVSTVEDGLRILRQGTVVALIADLPLLHQIVLQAGPACDLSFHNYKFPKQHYAFAIKNDAPFDIIKISDIIANVIPLNLLEESYRRHLHPNTTVGCWKESAAEMLENGDSTSLNSEVSLGVNSFAGVALLVLCAAVLCLAIKGKTVSQQHIKRTKISVTNTRD